MAQRRPNHHTRRNPSVDIPKYQPHSADIPPAPQTAPLHHIPAISDYESDNQGYLSDYPPHPPPPSRTQEELNRSVLKRHNSQITDILSIAPYAVIYEFSPSPEPAWTKVGIEGSLFICQLSLGDNNEDRYAAMVLNRRGLENFEAPLTEGENAGVEISDDYVIISYREAEEQKIYGVFIYSEGANSSTEHTREQIGNLMKALATQASVSRQAAEAAASQAQTNRTNGNIQEAEESLEQEQPGEHIGRQVSLQQLFGQQRASDASFSLRAHNVGGANPVPLPPSQSFGNNQDHTSHQHAAQQNELLNLLRGPPRQPSGPPNPPNLMADLFGQSQPARPQPHPQPDVLGDLFRNAGIGMR